MKDLSEQHLAHLYSSQFIKNFSPTMSLVVPYEFVYSEVFKDMTPNLGGSVMSTTYSLDFPQGAKYYQFWEVILFSPNRYNLYSVMF
jgi:hypothetical protein